MRPFLLYPDNDFSPRWGMLLKAPYSKWWRERDYNEQWGMLPVDRQILCQDLELDILLNAMAGGDKFLFEVCKNVVLQSLSDPDTIRYRQRILSDALQNPEWVREIYSISVRVIEHYRKLSSWYSHQSADSVRSSAINAIDLFLGELEILRDLGIRDGESFSSDGFLRLFSMLNTELDDEYLARVRSVLDELRMPNGYLIAASLGVGNKGDGYALQRYQKTKKKTWLKRLLSNEPADQYTFAIADRDMTGFKALAELKGRGVNGIANVLWQTSDHLFRFCLSLKMELGFYIGCLNLKDHLDRIGEPVCLPVPGDVGSRDLTVKGLYDLCLAIQMDQKVVGNDTKGEEKDLIVITGANRGGKSTYLRSVGLAQVLMQCGSFVPAEYFRSDVCTGLYTHFKREEDHSMKSGKFDEELKRMSDIVDLVEKDGLILFNESFAATNEREGSEISRQIISALLRKGIKVLFVTHLYEFSRSMYDTNMENLLFLRAERRAGGKRTFRVMEGKPLQTSYGRDLYARIFMEDTGDLGDGRDTGAISRQEPVPASDGDDVCNPEPAL